MARCAALGALRGDFADRICLGDRNPLVFSDNGDVISGGNFHGAPLALAFDYAAIAMTDLMSISERRIDRLVNPDPNEGLPAFLARRSRDAIRLHDRACRRRVAY